MLASKLKTSFCVTFLQDIPSNAARFNRFSCFSTRRHVTPGAVRSPAPPKTLQSRWTKPSRAMGDTNGWAFQQGPDPPRWSSGTGGTSGLESGLESGPPRPRGMEGPEIRPHRLSVQGVLWGSLSSAAIANSFARGGALFFSRVRGYGWAAGPLGRAFWR